MAFLPITREECLQQGWDAPDFVFVVGEAYVDHPSFGHAIISRVLEHAGYHIAMLCLPEFHTDKDFQRFGRPKLGFLITSGVIDSMVNHYTVAKKRRHEDVYAPGGQAGLRPDRAVTVYANLIHRAYPGVPVIIGGIEASLRRFSHSDYWDDKVRRSVLVDSAATLLVYGMGERIMLACADWVKRGMPQEELPTLNGCCYMAKQPPADAVMLPSHADVVSDKAAYARAFLLEYEEQDAVRGRTLCQPQDTQRFLVQNPPAMPLSREELDAVYALPYERTAHPIYAPLGGVPALEEVRFSVSAVRGCFGACNFCALTFHQGRIIQARSQESLVEEATNFTKEPDFKGYIHDVDGPTANFRHPSCAKQLKEGTCRHRQCLFPKPCPNLDTDHSDYLRLLRELRALPGIKKVFIRSGLRYDYLLAGKNQEFLTELCEHHVSGQLKVAPEHVAVPVIQAMQKAGKDVFLKFLKAFRQENERLGKEQYLVPYLMCSHPGSTVEDAVELAEFLRDIGYHPEQVQEFIPTPGSLSTAMYYTGIHPLTGRKLTVPRATEQRQVQRALLQFRHPKNRRLVEATLKNIGRTDLIGTGPACLIRPERPFRTPQKNKLDETKKERHVTRLGKR